MYRLCFAKNFCFFVRVINDSSTLIYETEEVITNCKTIFFRLCVCTYRGVSILVTMTCVWLLMTFSNVVNCIKRKWKRDFPSNVSTFVSITLRCCWSKQWITNGLKQQKTIKFILPWNVTLKHAVIF